MFQLIVSVIAIALVAILAAASIYYGGSAFSSSTAKGNVAALINAGQQIAGANALYKVDNTTDSTSIDDLATGVYLSAKPTPPRFAATGAEWKSTSSVAFIQLKANAATQVCAEVVNQGGAPTVAGSGEPTSVAGQFGCVNGYFVYRM